MDRINSSKRLHSYFDFFLGVISLALAMFFSAKLDWPVNALIGIIIISTTALFIVQHRKSYTSNDDVEQEI